MSQQSDEVKLAVMQNDLTYIREKVNTVDLKVSQNYVTKEEFINSLRRIKLLEKIVYGAVSLILIAVFGALTSLVVRR